jgi:hypothetical protein
LANGVAVDGTGRAYVVGYANQGSQQFYPTTPNALPTLQSKYAQTFLAVLDPTQSGNSSLVYSTLIGGTGSGDGRGDYGQAVAVDSFGIAYITGVTYSSDFPTRNAFQPNNNSSSGGGANGFISKLNPGLSGDAALIYSTYIGSDSGAENSGGGDGAGPIAVDSSGNAYVVGTAERPLSIVFPTTSGVFGGTFTGGNVDGFLLKLNAAGSKLIYSTFTDTDSNLGVAIDSFGNAYVTGPVTEQHNLPTTADAFQPATREPPNSGNADAFIEKVNPTASALTYCSYLGGSLQDAGTGVAVGPDGDAYVTGYTQSSDFPVVAGAYQPSINPRQDGPTPTQDAFVTRFPLGSPNGFSVSGIVPSTGGNSGQVTARVIGSGFHAGAAVSLGNIPGINPTVEIGGRMIQATFDLTKAAPGPLDVVVTNADGTTSKLSGAFAVVQGGAPDIRIGVAATSLVSSSPASYQVTVTNIGNIDAGETGLSGFLPAEVSLLSASPPPIASIPDLSSDGLIFWDPNPQVGGSQTFNYQVQCSQCTAHQNLTSMLCLSVNWQALGLCLAGVAGVCASPPVACGAVGTACALTPAVPSLGCLAAVGACKKALSGPCNAAPSVLQCISGSGNFIPCGAVQQTARTPGDPNNLVGSEGAGSQRWVPGKSPLEYILSFANDPTATAPAQQVTITNPIDQNSDPTSLQLVEINLIGIQVPIAPVFMPAVGQDELASTVDLRPSQNLLVNVDAKLDPVAKVLTWTFTSIDPATGQPPVDAGIGFLPAGGQGDVVFSVKPKEGLATGTQIQDQGKVVFNKLPADPTAVWQNTIDNTSPVSHVLALPTKETSQSFLVQWSGTDIGSGVQDFTIYTSDNGGSFSPWLQNTTDTSDFYPGVDGHTYGFFSQARDLAGNVEPKKATADTETQVLAASATPTGSATPVPTATSGATTTPTAAPTTTSIPTGTATPIPTSSSTASATPTPAPVAEKLAVTPKTLNFGKVAVGSSSKPRTITVRNGRGKKALPVVIEGESTGANFMVQDQCVKTLNPGDKCTVSVTFKPIATGLLHGQLMINDNAIGDPQMVKLMGIGK